MSVFCWVILASLALLLGTSLAAWKLVVVRSVYRTGFALGLLAWVGWYAIFYYTVQALGGGLYASWLSAPQSLLPLLLGLAGYLGMTSGWRYLPLALVAYGLLSLARFLIRLSG
jgi:hypothetical protein